MPWLILRGTSRWTFRRLLGQALVLVGRRYRAFVTQPGTTSEPVLPPGHLSRQAQPRLFVAGLTLRPWEHADALSLVRAYEDPDIHRWHSRSMSLTEAESWVAYELNRWEQERGGGWAITGADSLLGRIAIGSLALDEARAAVSYWVLPESRGRGVASLALSAVADWALDHVGFHRLELDHSTRNEASCRVAIKVGFMPEGTKRSQALHLDGWHDMHAHGLLASDARPRCRDA